MDSPVQVEPHVRSMTDGAGAVLLDLKAGRYYSLNGVAAAIWSRAQREMTLAEILRDLRSTYRMPAEKLAADLVGFVRSMQAKGLLRVRI
jgi:hypothetical protein